MTSWKTKSNIVLSLSVLIALVVLGQIGMYATHLMFGMNVHLNIFEFCLSLFKQQSFYYNLITYAMNAFIVHMLLIAIIRLVQQYMRLTRFKAVMKSLQLYLLTEQLEQRFDVLPRASMIVIEHAQPLAFTMGFRKPTIVLSSGLVRLLDEHELEAVIMHEAFHRRNYDALKLFVLQLISQSLWFIPLTRWSYANYKIMCELQADEHAIKETGSELGLGGALLKMVHSSGVLRNVAASPVLASFSDEAINYRLQQLVEPRRTIPLKLETPAIVISVYGLLLLMSMTILAMT
ncbi:M56 family metallopeptidase [Paenibacillus harenae]|uniref:Zn-dependent protease with chaperone function n=1 Tax=Paenibacillus harenae TaxID=306543 RepID=A0ABT9TZ79_PAEHA|nr:M56 family metallopeptidase [Paenibacillus harenae]MDQ0112682.1 Zn-dependent protease with chaperone function [Paenibacillus harenae]